MTITEIYDTYKINKGLREHMIRVAAVAQQICDDELEIDTETVLQACLLHDMGNLIKFKLDVAPEQLEPEGVEYWKHAQEEMIQKYGDDVYTATSAMVHEIVPDTAVERVVDEMSFDRIVEISKTGGLLVKISLYADMRAGMCGIISVDERFDGIQNRYVPQRFSVEELELRRQAAHAIEKEIFAALKIKPEDITDASTKDIQEGLLSYQIDTKD